MLAEISDFQIFRFSEIRSSVFELRSCQGPERWGSWRRVPHVTVGAAGGRPTWDISVQLGRLELQDHDLRGAERAGEQG